MDTSRVDGVKAPQHRGTPRCALRSISPVANCRARMGSTSKFNSKKLKLDEKSAAGGAWLATVESQDPRQLTTFLSPPTHVTLPCQ